MAVLKAVIFIAALLAIPVFAFLTVLCVVTDIVRSQQEEDENGM